MGAAMTTGEKIESDCLQLDQLDVSRPRTHSEHIGALQLGSKQPSQSMKSIDNGTYDIGGSFLGSTSEDNPGRTSETEKAINEYLALHKICQIAVKEYLTDVYNFEIEAP